MVCNIVSPCYNMSMFFIFDKRNTQFIETTLKTICCHTATLDLKRLIKFKNPDRSDRVVKAMVASCIIARTSGIL